MPIYSFSGADYTLLLLPNQDGVCCGNDWATGSCAEWLRKESWTPLVDDDKNGGYLMPIFALAYEHDPRSYDKPVSPELREKQHGLAWRIKMVFFPAFRADV